MGIQMKLLNLTAVSLAVVFTLTACGNDKPAEAPKTEPKAEQTATNTGSAEIDKLIIKSPYMDFVVNTNRAVIIKDIKSEFQVTPEQNVCLHSLEGNPNYLATLEPYVKGILNDAEIKEADAFFATDAGRKFSEMMLKQIGAENLPPFIEPTAEEKAEIAKAFLKAFFVKMKAKQDAMSEQEAIDFVMTMMKKEMERCKISK